VGGGAFPLICIPLVGRTKDAVLAEVDIVLPKKPDVLEWRVDFFEALGDTAHVIDTARAIRDRVGSIPVMFTRRSSLEGGEKIALAEPQVVQLYVDICASRLVDLIDYETVNAARDFGRLRAASREHDVALIGSYHNFQGTPDHAALAAKFALAHKLAADIAKVAVMPNGPLDVLTLLAATHDASQSLPVPLISVDGPVRLVVAHGRLRLRLCADLGRRQEQLGPGPGAHRRPAHCPDHRSQDCARRLTQAREDHRRRNPSPSTRVAPVRCRPPSEFQKETPKMATAPEVKKGITEEQQQELDEVFARARKALAVIETYNQARVDRLCQAVAWAVANKQTFTRLVDMGIKESGLGDAVSRMGKRMNIAASCATRCARRASVSSRSRPRRASSVRQALRSSSICRRPTRTSRPGNASTARRATA
jgi:3-dehydroquinate dehydratase-1